MQERQCCNSNMAEQTQNKTIRMPVDLIEAIEQLAEADDRTFSAWCIRALRAAASTPAPPRR